MKKTVTFFFTFIITAVSFLMPVTCHADNDDSSQTIRVWYYLVENTEADHPYESYYYDYLQEISQYTGWTYEYIDATTDEAFKMLADRELDLICGIAKTEEHLAQLDFSTAALMSTQYKFYVTAENDEVYYNDYQYFDGMTIGILVNNTQVSTLDTFCDTHGISIQKQFYDTRSDMEAALIAGEIDAIYDLSVSDDRAFRIVAHFSDIPLYFATWKGNGLINTVNDVQKTIRTTKVYFEYKLYQEDISWQQDTIPYFTREEMEYIQEHPEVYVAADPYRMPLEYTDPVTGEHLGIAADVLDLLEEYTGLTFVYRNSASYDESLQLFKDGEVDVLSTFAHDYKWALQNHANLSTDYLDSYIVMIDNPNENTGTDCVALPRSFHSSALVLEMNNYENILYFDTVEECIAAVSDGEADYTYANYYVAAYHLSNIMYRNLNATKINSLDQNLCIAVSQNADPRLLTIINKGLRSISTARVDEVVLSHSIYENELSLRTFLYAYPETVVFVIITGSALITVSLLTVLYVHYRKTRVIKTVSQTDSLTGILNRGAVQAKITMLLDKEKQSPNLVCPLISVDLDNFKFVNDHYGHPEGDLLLKAVAQVLKNSVRQSDIVGRMGGDEFLIYLTNVSDRKTAENIVAKLCAAVSALSSSKEEWSQITGSFGLAFGNENSTWTSLYHEADLALYDAKDKGKNQYSVYHNDLGRNLP